MDLTRSTARELSAAIVAGDVSSREVLDAHLDRIDAANPDINAVVTRNDERARADAEAADEELAAGHRRGPLHGVPMTIKDVWETKSMRTTSGAPELADHVPTSNATAVQRLVDAGAVIVGKTNTPLWAGDVQTYNDLFGVTNNPWDLGRTTGGSSGGAAAAVASGMTPLELGSDIGGSIRNPAHFCGIYGMKPTWGLIPTRGHIPGPPGTLSPTDVNCGGPLARSIDDLALAFDVLAGPEPGETGWRLDLPAARPRDGVKGLRVALTLGDATFPVSSAVQDRLKRAATALESAGAIVEERPLPVPTGELFGSWQRLVLPVIGAGLPDHIRLLFDSVAADQGDDIAGRAVSSLVASWRDWARANERRAHHRRAWDANFDSWDLVMCPAMPVAAFVHDIETSMGERTYDLDGASRSYLDLMAWCGMIGAVLLPVVSVPMGLTPDGLPVGAQLVGRHANDLDLLSMARSVDEAVGGFVAQVRGISRSS